MTEAVLEKEPLLETPKTRKISVAVGEKLTDGIDMAKRVGRKSSEAVEEFMDDTTVRFKRHPVESVVGAFTVGILLGTLVGGIFGWTARRR